MKNELKIEIERVTKSKGLLAAFIIGIAISVSHFMVMVWPLRDSIMVSTYPLSAFGKWIGGENASIFPTLYYFIVPILIAIPFAGSYKEDLSTGYIKNILQRTSRKNYLKAKYVTTFFSGGIISVVPLISNYILTAMILPSLIPQSSTGQFPIFSNSMLGELFYSHPYIYMMIYIFINFIFFGLLATLALAAADICDSLFATVLFPFVIYLLVYAVTQLINLHILCPFGFLRPSQPIVTEPFVLCGELVLMCIAGGIYYYVGKKKDIY